MRALSELEIQTVSGGDDKVAEVIGIIILGIVVGVSIAHFFE